MKGNRATLNYLDVISHCPQRKVFWDTLNAQDLNCSGEKNGPLRPIIKKSECVQGSIFIMKIHWNHFEHNPPFDRGFIQEESIWRGIRQAALFQVSRILLLGLTDIHFMKSAEMDALADVAGLFKVTLSSMVCPSTAPTMVVTANPCPDLVIGKLSKGCTLAQVMPSLITERTITFH